ncbi:tryptophan 7-halogenase [Alteromonas sp. ASW11-36]|uniref:Tryptophan 7-halogenase n=1 Tax=Alteromonas arenosi TaxID=3055817 RepID=A0ABT7SWX2_9ALTE|nr:tryptophan halogenase family protein [Alteromonas sp. ASW11-36]MDM7860691.1 tryptophan 7-halogenase [Alteromonas sp. ASW11-36]
MRKVVILGGGTAGWMAANLMATLLPKEAIQVTLIESPDIGIIGVGEGSTPTLKRFFTLCDIAESEWMPACNATYKVNIRFAGWSPQSGIESYSHPFISQVDTFTERAFEVNCHTRRLGLNTHTKPEDFLLNGVLAQQQKGPITPESFPFRMEYGYHFDSYLLGAFLRDKAKSKGIGHVEGEVVDVQRHNNGDIATLKLKGGQTISADFFIDCTGFAAVLIQKTLNVPFQSFANNLFNNAAVVIPTSAQAIPAVETRATALSHGWYWQIPLQNRTGNGYVYSDLFVTADDAEKELRTTLGVADDVEARHLKMRVGQLQQHWAHNCLGLGLSQGFIEPLEATALHLVQVCIEMFIDKWQTGNFTAQHRDVFNQQMSKRFEHVRDYIVAHYKLNTRNDSEYWRANRENNQFSDSLGHILNAWFTKQDLRQEIERQQLESHFGSVSWHCLLSGYGAYPKLAAEQPGKGDLYHEQGIETFLQGCALNFQPHAQNLQQLVHRIM